ncbi:hypothetical protein KDA08_05805 [Candidatus Saccharibacteria bacterium]|nr:hypothetical protein [Candidatus Saccharibacteria bacterium]
MTKSSAPIRYTLELEIDGVKQTAKYDCITEPYVSGDFIFIQTDTQIIRENTRGVKKITITPYLSSQS